MIERGRNRGLSPYLDRLINIYLFIYFILYILFSGLKITYVNHTDCKY